MRGGDLNIQNPNHIQTCDAPAVTHVLLCAAGEKEGIVLRIEEKNASISIKCVFGEISFQRSEMK